MFKSYYTSIFVLIIYLWSCLTQGNADVPEDKKLDKEYPAFTLVKELYKKKEGSQVFQLPSIMDDVRGEMKLSALMPAEDDEEEEKYLCPEIKSEHDAESVQALNTIMPETKSCLFTTKFCSNEQKSCAKELIPWLKISENKFDANGSINMLSCSQTDDQELLTFVYNVCDPVDNFLSAAENIKQNNVNVPEKNSSSLITATFPMYYICYNFKSHTAVWTKHQVLQPMLIYNEMIQEMNKNLEISDEINLEKISSLMYGLDLYPENFPTNWKKTYENNKLNMEAQYLVPSKHMALPSWKKTTKHLINTAPLQPKFRKLMNVIDEGIAKISIRKFTTDGTNLHIFTKVHKIDGKPADYYNIWYKLIYDEQDKSGALIYLYNTPDLPKQLICDNNLKCKFNKWAKDLNLEIDADLENHVGCCQTTKERAKALFQVDLNMTHSMDISHVYGQFHKDDIFLDRISLSFLKERGVKPRGGSLQIVPVTQEKQLNETAEDEKQVRDEPENPNQQEGPHDAFIVVRPIIMLEEHTLSNFQLPTNFWYQEEETDKKLHLARGGNYSETPLCPEDPSTNNFFELLNEVIPATKNCLFIKNDEQEKCKREPTASLQTIGKRRPIICGINKKQQLIRTEFLNCGTKETIHKYLVKFLTEEDASIDKTSYVMYETCYDFKNEKTLWTRHAVLYPELLAHEMYPYKYLDTIKVNEISTDIHDTKLKQKTLEKLKASYVSNELNESMVHINLVPKKHMALPYWKKSTSHITNTAPLFPKFKLLMEAIDEGIFKASAYVLSQYDRELKIYTKVKTQILSNRKNTWYKFIHDKGHFDSGILIVLHNNTEGVVKNRKCAGEDIKECNFQTWIDAETSIPAETLAHAYCCAVPGTRIRKLFSMPELEVGPIQEPLDLQEMITSYPKLIRNGKLYLYHKIRDGKLESEI